MQGARALAAQLETKRAELAEMFDAHRDTEGGYDFTPLELEEVNRRNDELNELGQAWETASRLETLAARNQDELKELRRSLAPLPQAPSGAACKSLGDLFVASDTYRRLGVSGGPASLVPDYDLKTLFSTSAGWAPEDRRGSRVVLDEQEDPAVADLLPQSETTRSTVLYMEETTYTNNAAEVAEGGTSGEAALALTERSSEVRRISVWLPFTDEQVDDEPRARDYVNNRLTHMLKQRLDQQILTGNGTAPNLTGILSASGVQTQAKGTDPAPDAVHKAITLVRVNGKAQPNLAIFHPNDWQDFRLLRTTDGLYIWGNPADSIVPRIWGVRVLQTTFMTENSAVVGDFRNYSELAFRRGIEFEITNAHSTYFVEGKKAIRADFRCALLWYRTTAFCTVTGL